MYRAKMVAMILAAVCVVSALGAASASASWFVGGSELKTSAALATVEVIDEVSTMSVPRFKLAIVCGGGTLGGVNPEIIAGSSVKAEALKFLECKVTEPASGCVLEPSISTITTNPITAHISLGVGDSDRVVFSPQTKSLVTQVQFNEANTCAYNGLQPVTGSVVDNVPGGQLEGVTETLTGMGSVENNSLEVNGNNLYIIGGKALAKLASGSKWSFK